METHSDKRVQRLRETLVNTKGGDLVWIAAAPELDETTILTGTVWTDMQGQQRSIAQRT